MKRSFVLTVGLFLALGPLQTQAQSLPQGAAILKAAYAQSAGMKYYAWDSLPLEMAPYDPDRALTLGQRVDGTVPDSVMAGVIGVLAQVDPAKAAQWGLGALAHIQDPAQKREAAVGLALAVVRVRPTVAATLYQTAKLGFAPEALFKDAGADWGKYADILQFVDLAAAEKDPQAEAWLDQGIAQIKKAFPDTPNGGVNEVLTAAAEGIAPFSPTLAEKVILQMPAEQRAPAYARSIAAMADSDPVAAQALFAKMDAAAPNAIYIGQAELSLIPVLGKTDPAAALSLARKVGQDWQNHKSYALATAAAFEPPLEAAKLYAKAAESVGAEDRHAGSVLGWVCASAYNADPVLGARLFADAHRRLLASPNPHGLADFAFFYAQVDPVESKRLIENAYAAPTPEDGGDGWGQFSAALAMAAVDTNRALKLADGIADVNFRFDAQRKVAQYVLAPTPVRRTLRFDRWSATDTWRPGTPTGW